jgi:hypothetical protein
MKITVRKTGQRIKTENEIKEIKKRQRKKNRNKINMKEKIK